MPDVQNTGVGHLRCPERGGSRVSSASEPKLFGCPHGGVVGVWGPQVATDDVRPALAAVREATGLMSEAVGAGLQPDLDCPAAAYRLPVGDDVHLLAGPGGRCVRGTW